MPGATDNESSRLSTTPAILVTRRNPLAASRMPMFTVDGIRTFRRWTHTSLSVLLDHLSTIPPDSYAQPAPDTDLNQFE